VETDADVAIVGFGPVGAVIAGLLGKRGLRVVIFDRHRGLYPLPRAAHIDHTGLRTLQELGCLDRLLPHLLLNPGTDCVTADRKLLFQIPGDVKTVSGLPASMYFHQPTFDAELRRTAAGFPSVDVQLGCEVVDAVERADGVTLTVEDAGTGRRQVTAPWVVGCDGATSVVRQLAGIETEDFGFAEQWLIFDLHLHDPPPPMPAQAIQVCDPRRPRTELPMPDNHYRFELMLMPGETADEQLGPDVAVPTILASLIPPGTFDIERTGTYTFRGVVARHFRAGRLFLAGDAAHLMPPFLGQGMNSGIRDATNLAWKLERVICDNAPQALLDTYEPERRPHVAKIIQTAVDFGRIICATDPEVAAKRDRDYLADTRPLDDRFHFRLPRLGASPLVLDGGGTLFPQPQAAPGARLDDWVGANWLVLASERSALGPAAGWWEAAGARVATVDEVPDPSGTIARWLARTGKPIAVMRPDRHVAATTSDLSEVTQRVRPLLEAAG
jgi:3-(3-hydroxy-phenyl)propionate hydroxylase